MTDGADEELRRGSSWAKVRQSLRLLVIVWVLLTLIGVLTQMLTADLAMRARVGDEQARATLALASLAHQLAYSVFALVLAFAALGLTRAPPRTRTIPFALVATGCFVAVFVLNLVVGIAERTPAEVRVTTADTLRIYWLLLALARGIGVVALLATTLRLAAFLGKGRRPFVVGVALMLALVDGAYPIYRLFAPSAGSFAESSPWMHRGLVLGLQLAVAFFLIDTALRVRQAAEDRPEETDIAPDSESEPEPEPEAEAESDSEPEPEAESDSEAEPDSEPEPEAESDSEAGADSEAESDSAPELRAQTRLEQIVGSVAVAVAVALLPIWDAVAAGGFGSGLRMEAGSVFPTGAVAFLVGGIVGGVLLARTLSSSPYAARGVFGVALFAALGYLGLIAWDTALDRSRRIDSFAVCETMAGVEGEIVTLDREALRHRFDGPHLPNGQPCTSIIEDRATHRAEYPDGSFRDGMIQISRHFPDDRMRFFQIPLISLVLLVISGVIVARAARLPRPKT